jgi:alkylated DNA repair dioxygenase AlkB
MDLFDDPADGSANLLPRDGEAYYHGRVLPLERADSAFETLRANIAWAHDESRMFGKRIQTRRKVAWYGDAPFEYTYSGSTKTALPWTRELLKLKASVECACDESFNSCLLNLYHDGSEGMAWHSDGEADLLRNGAIASLSLGAERKFAFKHRRSGNTVSLVLQHGSLLVMTGVTQQHWLHRLPPTKKVSEPRVNLTFRTIVTAPPTASHPR